jgi:phosphomethylpyrimidine synthase
MTQLELARDGVVTEVVNRVAQDENIDPELLRACLADGTVVIPLNKKHQGVRPVGIGRGLRIKVNANIGTSGDRADLDMELKKLHVAIEAKTDTIMDLSTGGDIVICRKAVMKNSTVPVGTVPIYEAAIHAVRRDGGIIHMTPDLIFDAIESQAQNGVDFMTIHAGVTLAALERLRLQGRVTDIVSRGGAFLATWMLYHKRENPLFEDFDRLLNIAKRFDVTLSLGDGLRPGSLADATDRAQIHELLTLGELAKRAWDNGVQVMIEGPGHIPLDQVETQVVLQKKLCGGAPFYVLGPLVTDIAAGYDHIACAIGGAVAGMAGADFLCYVTPSEHLRLPLLDDVRDGVIAARIAAHAADIARGRKEAIERDLEMSTARKNLDWDRQISISIDPDRARAYRSSSQPSSDDVCTMCGDFCAIKIVRAYLADQD